jgi:nucleotide-binding universal stress UspA family protein
MQVRTILFPIDFSAIASNALDFAAAVAVKLEASLLFLHVNRQPYAAPARESGSISLDSVNTSLINEKLAGVLSDVELKFGISCRTQIEEGDPEQVIPAVALSSQADLLLMGTMGYTESEALPTDSLTTRVMDQTKLPMLIIPSEARYDSLDRWLYAFDRLEKEKGILEQVFRLASGLGAQVELLHVQTNRQDGDNNALALESIRQHLPGISTGFKVINGDSVLEGLSHYIDTAQPDLLVMARHDRSFFERLFNRDIVKTAANQINFPLLVLHG